MALSQKVEIVCAQCYLKGVASAELVIGGRLNASQYVQKSINAVSGEVDEFTDAVGEYIEDYLGDIWEGITEFNLDDVQLPTLEYDFAIDGLEPVPDVTLHLQFDGLVCCTKSPDLACLLLTIMRRSFSCYSIRHLPLPRNTPRIFTRLKRSMASK